MKNLLMTVSFSFLAAVGLRADPLALGLGMNGEVRIGSAGVHLGMSIHHQGWNGTSRGVNKSFAFPDAKSGTAKVEFYNGNTLCARGLSTLQAGAADAAFVRAELTSTCDQKPESVVLSLELPVDVACGGSWEDDAGKKGTFPVKWDGKTVGMYRGSIRSFTIQPAKGEAFTLKFPKACGVMLQDNRTWTQSFTVRIQPLDGLRNFNTNAQCAFACSVTSPDGTNVSIDQPVVVKAGADWTALDYCKDIEAGSALDFSNQGLLDAPAGKHGWLKNENGHFVFEKLPGKPQRFYGVNLCFDASYPDAEFADQIATRLARLGYNTVRIHHYESDRGAIQGSADGLALNAERMQRLDYLLAKFIEKGIYITTDLFTIRPVKWRAIGIDRDGDVDRQVYKNLVAIYEPAYQNWCAFAKNLLTHVNPYTGRAYKDEPALPLISLINENTILWCWDKIAREAPMKTRWKEWLARKRAQDPDYATGVSDDPSQVKPWGNPVAIDFMVDQEQAMVKRQRAFLRGLGVKALLTNQNCAGTEPAMAAMRRATYDYVDNHFYVDHPQFLARSWSLPSRCDNGNPVLSSTLAPVTVAATRQKGLPFTVTEWNFSGPGMYRGVGGIMTGAVAALQDWDGLWRFAYAHGLDAMRDRAGLCGYFDVASDPLGQAGDRASVCLFLRGDLPAVGMDADVAASPSLQIDKTRGSFSIDTPKTAGGFSPSGRLVSGPVAFDPGETATTLWASAVDGRPIATSRRLLVTHLTDVQANGNVYADSEKRVLLKWGSYPPVVRNGRAKVELAVAKPRAFAVWALETTGRRLEKIPSQVVDGKLVFTVDVKGPNGARMLYELAREP